MLLTDPINLKLTADGDADIAAWASDGAFVAGIDAVISGVRTRLLLIRGEWFLDLDAGVPWFERDGVPGSTAILGGKFDANRVRGPILRAILDAPGVREVLDLKITYDGATRSVVVTWAARTVFGDTPTSSTVLAS